MTAEELLERLKDIIETEREIELICWGFKIEEQTDE